MAATLHRLPNRSELDSWAHPELNQLYVNHARWLLSALRRRYGDDAADELTQETYARLAKVARTQDVRHPRAFLLRIADNLAKNRLRASRRRPTEPLDERTHVGAHVEAPQVHAVLFRQILLALSPELRDVFVLNHVRGMTHQEIAQLLGISVKTVEKRMKKALALCAVALRD